MSAFPRFRTIYLIILAGFCFSANASSGDTECDQDELKKAGDWCQSPNYLHIKYNESLETCIMSCVSGPPPIVIGDPGDGSEPGYHSWDPDYPEQYRLIWVPKGQGQELE